MKARQKRWRLSLQKVLCMVSIFVLATLSAGTWKLSQTTTLSSHLPSINHRQHSPNPSNHTTSLFCNDPAVSFLRIDPAVQRHQHPKILCLVLTQSENHATRMQAVKDTWGRKCDILVGSSNATDLSLNTYAIDSVPGYWGIYDKLLQTLRWILFDKSDEWGDFDWILKADDDTYVLMENLHAFLNNLTDPYEEARVYGRVMAFPRLKRFKSSWFSKDYPNNQEFGKRFYAKLGDSQTLRYCHGGPGYFMNRKYVQLLVDVYFNATGDSLKGEIAEDMGSAATMLYHDVRPKSTYDFDTGRERMHPESPQTMFKNPDWLLQSHHGIKSQLKGAGEVCCSPTSISYHYISGYQMRLLEHQLYVCPKFP